MLVGQSVTEKLTHFCLPFGLQKIVWTDLNIKNIQFGLDYKDKVPIRNMFDIRWRRCDKISKSKCSLFQLETRKNTKE